MLREKKPRQDIAEPWAFTNFTLDIPSVRDLTSPIDDEDQDLAEAIGVCSPLKLPDLENFHYGPLETNSPPVNSIPPTVHGARDNESEAADVWSPLPCEHYDASKNVVTWSQFADKVYREPQIYLSEVGDTVWNAVWQQLQANQDHVPLLLRQDDTLRPLVDLNLGLNSSIFGFELDDTIAYPDGLRISGMSAQLTESIISEVGFCGKLIRKLEKMTGESGGWKNIPRTAVAIHTGINRIVTLVKRQISRSTFQTKSILQIQDSFRRPATVLSKLDHILVSMRHCRDDPSVVEAMVQFTIDSQFDDEAIYRLLLELLRLVAKPVIEDVSRLCGLFVQDQCASYDRVREDLLLQKLPNLFIDSQQTLIQSIHTGLTLLRTHQPNGTLLMKLQDSAINANASLDLSVTWAQLDSSRKSIAAYHQKLGQDAHGNEDTEGTFLQKQDEERYDATLQDLDHLNSAQSEARFLTSIEELNSLPAKTTKDDELSIAAIDVCQNPYIREARTDLQPPLSIFLIESFTPLLNLQARVINQACLRMIFQDHRLMHNLQVLYDFHLLGSGIFSARLKEALFSPDMSSAERKKGRHRAGRLGLRLGSRTTWPPASAEIRLSLMGILSDCYHASYNVKLSKTQDDLPGDLAFAIRNLTEPEIAACTDASSVAALDFLRLQYKPPKALDTIITEDALDKYDRIFRFLLRLCRVSFATDQTWMWDRDSNHLRLSAHARFKFQARHFIQSLQSYVYSTIAIVWSNFQNILVTIEAGIEGQSGSEADHCSLDELLALHNLALDRVLSSLLLKRRYEKVMLILEEILGIILIAESGPETLATAELIADFKVKVKLFISVCRDLGQKEGSSATNGPGLSMHMQKAWSTAASPGDGLASLVVLLDYAGNFTGW